MIRMCKVSVVVGLLALPGLAMASTEGFGRYRVILDRMPFGDAPAVVEPPAPTPVRVSPAESFARHIRIAAMNQDDEGNVRVGLVDNQKKTSYFLAVGESHEGIELVSANYEEGEAVLRRGSEMAILKPQSAEVQPITREELQERQRGRQAGYEERRRQRAEEAERRRREPPPEPRLTGEELEQHLLNYQMEVIRQGLPPLPIQLTPEADQQLVEEGVLPPL